MNYTQNINLKKSIRDGVKAGFFIALTLFIYRIFIPEKAFDNPMLMAIQLSIAFVVLFTRKIFIPYSLQKGYKLGNNNSEQKDTSVFVVSTFLFFIYISVLLNIIIGSILFYYSKFANNKAFINIDNINTYLKIVKMDGFFILFGLVFIPTFSFLGKQINRFKYKENESIQNIYINPTKRDIDLNDLQENKEWDSKDHLKDLRSQKVHEQKIYNSNNFDTEKESNKNYNEEYFEVLNINSQVEDDVVDKEELIKESFKGNTGRSRRR